MQQPQQQSGGFQRVLSDVVDLCELQWQLLSVDGQEAKRRAAKAAIFMGLGGVIALASMVAAVMAGGWLLHEQFDLSLGVSFLLTSGATILIAIAALVQGAKLLARANESLSETKQEFAENVRWIKSVLLSPSSSPRNQLRREDFAPGPPPAPTAAQNGRF